MFSKEKDSAINTALEGGKRLSRRLQNVLTAFTYGKKYKYQDIDDPFFVFNVINSIKKNSKKSKNLFSTFQEK